MNNRALVSIITPCYNSENYLERYLINILQQTYENVQLILVNDGSTDSTEEIILKYIKAYQENGYSLIYVKQENKGLGGAINTALKYVTGEYFTWCDSDNFYTKDYIEEKVNFFLKNPQYSIVRCDGFIVQEGDINHPLKLMSGKNTDKFQENMFKYCLYEKNFHFGCAMLRTSDFDKVVPNREIYPSRHGQNWQLLLPMFYYYKSGYIDKPMFYFVYRENSVSNCVKKQSLEKKYEQQEEYCRIIVKTLTSMNISEREEYIRSIKIKYSKRCMRFAMNARDIPRLKQEYANLQQVGAVDRRVKWMYRIGRYKIFYFAFRVLSAIKNH